jgi:hypothetical protein
MARDASKTPPHDDLVGNHGDPEPDDKIIAKYLRVPRPRYCQLVVSIETLLDISTLSAEWVMTTLKAAEEDNAAGNCDDEKLISQRSSGLRSKSRRSRREAVAVVAPAVMAKDAAGGKSKSSAASDSGGDRSGTVGTRGKDKCRSYGKIGLWARECHSRPKHDEQALAIKDDEPTLMLAETDISFPNLGPSPHLCPRSMSRWWKRRCMWCWAM